MSSIEQLISEDCSRGVEYTKLVDIAQILYGFPFQSKMFTEDEKYIPLIRIRDIKQGKASIYYKGSFLPEFIIKKGDMIVGMDGEFNLNKWNDRESILNQRVCKIVSNNEKIANNNYLFHLLIPLFKKIESETSGSTVKHLSARVIQNIIIPLPPLPIQQEIVRILDTFTDLDAELQAELEARKKQYEHYRNQLLNFEGKEVEWKMLGDLTDFMNGKGHEKEIVENGKYIVVNSKFISTDGTIKKYSNNQLSPIYIDDILIVMSDLPNGKALAKCFYVEKDNVYTLNQRIGRLSVNYKYEVTPKYIFFILNRNKQLLKYDNGSDQTNLRKNQILEIKIPIPPLAEQERIVSILDKFEALVNDELPAEIAARRKQYEHYREKLLTFEPLVS